ncbi:hypothetical protein [uncultured Gammaproteobacteria bacterium]|uniref:Uncharacterized protein n=2 Tax=sulfur-oxidizing symbionts TaxID=32036 RepID=A0A1H6M4N1_9GAMM|nr:hypothetical protein AZO1586I_676 [Bathymodiolus thermophilus thioautotrophic gill symbiont]CAC9496707.1 hypothetical protein [uncultured Gammaproteobacteria bacterium]CAC9526725.1 hypothetical protein [uncultured Gammaproteobacteria bacterium]SEH96142.1 hypothetical protein BAZSYMA_ACONTIG54005_1 [Bathymodiolus azoricus thioautotrophic gill symbiont]
MSTVNKAVAFFKSSLSLCFLSDCIFCCSGVMALLNLLGFYIFRHKNQL